MVIKKLTTLETILSLFLLLGGGSFMTYLWSQKLRFLSWEEATLYGIASITALLLALSFIYFLYAYAKSIISSLKGSSDLNLSVSNFSSYAAGDTPNSAKFMEIGVTVSTKGLSSYIQRIDLSTNLNSKSPPPKFKNGKVLLPKPQTGTSGDVWFENTTEITSKPQTIFILFEVFVEVEDLTSKDLVCELTVLTTRGFTQKIKFAPIDI